MAVINIKNDEAAIFCLILIFNLILITAFQTPFQFDEGTYSFMVKDISEHPEHLTPAIFGEHTEWKPPLFFWIYGIFYYFLKQLSFLSVEMVFRIPTAFFAAVNASLIFNISKKMYNEKVAFASVTLYVITPIVMAFSTMAMMETLSVFFLLTSLYFYLEKKTFQASIFLACLTSIKWLYSFGLLAIIFAYFWNDRYIKKIFISAAAIPLAILFHFLISYFAGSFSNAFYMYFTLDSDRIQVSDFETIIYNFKQLLTALSPIYLALSFLLLFIGKTDIYREKHLILSLFLLYIFLFIKKFFYWYIFPLLPFIAILSALMIYRYSAGLEKILFFGIIIILLVSAVVLFPGMKNLSLDVKEVAEFTKQHEKVLFYVYATYQVWSKVEEKYGGTDEDYLLIESYAPGFLFYTYADSYQKPTASIIIKEKNETINCNDTEFLIIITHKHSNYESLLIKDVPLCFAFYKKTNNGEYIIYKKKLYT